MCYTYVAPKYAQGPSPWVTLMSHLCAGSLTMSYTYVTPVRRVPHHVLHLCPCAGSLTMGYTYVTSIHRVPHHELHLCHAYAQGTSPCVTLMSHLCAGFLTVSYTDVTPAQVMALVAHMRALKTPLLAEEWAAPPTGDTNRMAESENVPYTRLI
jgi:hypothetical protein